MKIFNLKITLNIIALTSIFFISGGCENITHKNSNYELPNKSSLDLSNTFVYDENSKYKTILQKCIITNLGTKSCTLNELPLIREDGNITLNKIKERLVVSHKWMGDRFLELLDKLDSDVLEMLGAVTAIVIDDDIRPAFYTTQTGAIYIDPRYLWLSPQEARDIKIKDDFRSGYGSSLKFVPAWRYVKDSQLAIKYWDITNPKQRSIEDIKLNFARLLYHELTHANDFANQDVIESANKDIPIVQALENGEKYRISTQLYQSIPLTQPTLIHLGQVLFMGDNATQDDKNMMPSDVGALFTTDNATNMYNYANQYEDVAMLFESAMMKYHYNIEMDIAFTSNPKNPTNCDDYVVGWGVRNRIAKDTIKPRIKFLLNKILPNRTNWDDFVDNNIGTKQELSANVGWCSSINLDNNSQNSRYTNENQSKPIPYQDFKAPEL